MQSPFTPAPTFDDPIAMLVACHDKIRRFTSLSLKIDEHVVRKGVDEEAQQAAASVLRYFDVAAPLHHADEEDDLFPALRALDDAALTARIEALELEHAELLTFWLAVRPWLETIVQGGVPVRPAELQAFVLRYPEHAQREERDIYPAAQRIPAGQLVEIGRRMQQRRGHP